MKPNQRLAVKSGGVQGKSVPKSVRKLKQNIVPGAIPNVGIHGKTEAEKETDDFIDDETGMDRSIWVLASFGINPNTLPSNVAQSFASKYRSTWKQIASKQAFNGSVLEFYGMTVSPGFEVWDAARHDIVGSDDIVLKHIMGPVLPGEKPRVYLKTRFPAKFLNELNELVNPQAPAPWNTVMWSGMKKLAKGVDSIEPDLIIRFKNEIRVYELKIGNGKLDPSPMNSSGAIRQKGAAECHQLMRVAKVLNTYANQLGGKFFQNRSLPMVRLYFVAWQHGYNPSTKPDFVVSPLMPTTRNGNSRSYLNVQVVKGSEFQAATSGMGGNGRSIQGISHTSTSAVLRKLDLQRLKALYKVTNELFGNRGQFRNQMTQSEKQLNEEIRSLPTRALGRVQIVPGARATKGQEATEAKRINELARQVFRPQGFGVRNNERYGTVFTRPRSNRPQTAQRRAYSTAKQAFQRAGFSSNQVRQGLSSLAPRPINVSRLVVPEVARRTGPSVNLAAASKAAQNAANVQAAANANTDRFREIYGRFLTNHANLEPALNAKLRQMANAGNAGAAVKLRVKEVANAARREMNLG
jgi:hypothetical protein